METEKKKSRFLTARRLLLVVLILAGGVLLAAFARGRKKEPVYFTSTVERGDIRSEVTATGTINAVVTVQVGSQVSGIIEKLLVDFNSRVKKGQVVAQLDQSIFQAQVQQAEADLQNSNANARALEANIETMKADLASAEANVEKAQATERQAKLDYDRNLDLFKQGIVAAQVRDQMQNTYDAAVAATKASRAAAEHSRAAVQSSISQLAQAKAQIEQKKAALDLAKVNLAYTTIYAPVDGVVVARNVDRGQTVAASLSAPTLYTIAQDLTKMLVYAKTDESDVGNIHVGSEVTFKVDAYPRETFTGRVSQIRMNPQTIQNVVTYDTVIQFDNPDEKLLPGMTAYVTIPVARAQNAIKIPNGALRFRLEEPERQALFAKYNFKDKRSGGRAGLAAADGDANGGGESGGGRQAGGGGRRKGGGGGAGGGDPDMAAGSGDAERKAPVRRPAVQDVRTLYVLQPDKTIRPVVVRTGITDFTFTECASVLQGELKPGEEVVTGKELPNRGIGGMLGRGGMGPMGGMGGRGGR